MPRLLLLAIVSVFLLATPVLAGDPEALFSDDASLFAAALTPRVNGKFLAANARLKASWALKQPTSHQLVVSGGKVTTDQRDVTIGGLTLKPGAEIPPSVRSVIIIGGQTKDVIVSGGRNIR